MMTQPDHDEQWNHAQYLCTHHIDSNRLDNVALCGVMLYNKLGATTKEATTCPECLERLDCQYVHRMNEATEAPVTHCGLGLPYDSANVSCSWDATTCPQCLLAHPCLDSLTPESPTPRAQDEHPSYYHDASTGKDLYALFIARYGLEAWLRHVEMECIQYLFRAPHKGQYVDDIRKVKVICERILAECHDDARRML